MKGKFITFEGSEGSGKTTQIKIACEYLRKKKKKFLFVREPGGVKISEKVRAILLDVENTHMGDECETLLYMAARAQLVKEVIKPALQKGLIVLCDRFLDSTIAYQGYGNGVDIKFIKMLGEFATTRISPDLTILFDIDTKLGLSRTNKNKDRIERRALSYHSKVRNGYLRIASKEPNRVKVIKVNRGVDEISFEVRRHINKLLGIKDE